MINIILRKLAREYLSKEYLSNIDKEITKNAFCSEFEVDGWAVSGFILSKIIPVTGYTPFPLAEINLMVSAVCRLQPTLIFEWGTNIGKSARIFYETINHFNILCQIHSVDLPEEISHREHPHKQRGLLVKNLEKVFLHLGDGVETALSIWGDQQFTSDVLFFLDGDHDYQSVKRELLEIISSQIKPKGILVHDTFYQSQESGYNIGPYQAIEDVWQNFIDLGYRKIDTQISLPGMTLIYKL